MSLLLRGPSLTGLGPPEDHLTAHAYKGPPLRGHILRSWGQDEDGPLLGQSAFALRSQRSQRQVSSLKKPLEKPGRPVSLTTLRGQDGQAQRASWGGARERPGARLTFTATALDKEADEVQQGQLPVLLVGPHPLLDGRLLGQKPEVSTRVMGGVGRPA